MGLVIWGGGNGGAVLCIAVCLVAFWPLLIKCQKHPPVLTPQQQLWNNSERMSSGGSISQVPVSLAFSHSYNTTSLWSFKAVYIISYSFPTSPEPFPSFQVCLLFYWLYYLSNINWNCKIPTPDKSSLSSETKLYPKSNPPTLTDECFYIFLVYIGLVLAILQCLFYLLLYNITNFPFLLKHFSHPVPISFLADVFL